jgi:HlyD family secretion protein
MKIGSLVTLLIIAGAGAGLYFWATQPEPPPSYKTAELTKGSIEEKVTATGTLSALKTVIVGSQISGIVKEVYVDYNDTVTKDQLLAELDPASLEAQKVQAESAVSTALAQKKSAEAKLTEAKNFLKRAEDLYSKSLIPKAELESAQSAVEIAKAQVDSATAQIVEASSAVKISKLSTSKTKIYSPIDGIIINRKIDIGQTVAASFSAPELFTIAQDLRKMQVIADIDEADVGKLKEQMQAIFTVDAFPGEEFKGTIVQIRFSPTSTNGVVTYAAVIQVENPELKLRPGMTANVEITSTKHDNVLLVPNTALRFIPPDNVLKQKEKPTKEGEKKDAKPGTTRGKVYIRDGDLLVGVPLVIGISDGKNAEVLEGNLKEGDEIVTEIKKNKSGSGSKPPGGTRF